MRTLRIVASVTLVLAGAIPALIAACTSTPDNLLGGGGTTHHDGDAGLLDDADATTIFVNDDAPSEFIPDVVIDTFLPLNMVDAADIADGGRPVTPGVIQCPGVGTCNAFAGNQCCADDDGGACIAATVPCGGGGALTCNESADCVVGKVCCGTLASDDAGGAPYLSAGCAVSCTPPAPALQLCRTNGECGEAGACVVQNCSDGRTYEICGVFVGPPLADGGLGFTCTPQ